MPSSDEEAALAVLNVVTELGKATEEIDEATTLLLRMGTIFMKIKKRRGHRRRRKEGENENAARTECARSFTCVSASIGDVSFAILFLSKLMHEIESKSKNERNGE